MMIFGWCSLCWHSQEKTNRISVISVNKKKCGLINAKYIGKMQ